ncbi:hypothetical protein B0I35DRAFT_194242 [Stachybotrys elegans]|uniref:Zn(2)-C6 fungal-type domain-containing protein n=1 Tax=Stachybotrys elegans TaxID=80388 RepID=A0A8K0SWG7_9HYPO|nr:hypothetical protein B0I35DRAFT_194242 [Stachybotrys elegans]
MESPDLGRSSSVQADLQPKACAQCRARKVKCDRRVSGCLRCERMKLPCSYIAGELGDTNVHRRSGTDNGSSQELTQAGIKRRRVQRSCQSCRAQKVKCSGKQPCTRCESQTRSCIYSESPAATRDESVEARPSQAMSAASHPPVPAPLVASALLVPSHTGSSEYAAQTPKTMTTAGSQGSLLPELGSIFDLNQKSLIRGCLDAFFDLTDLIDCLFLHKATTMAEWKRGRLDSTLVKAICAHGLHLTSPQYRGEHSIANQWIREIRAVILTTPGTSIAQLQTLLLLVKFGFMGHFDEDVYMLLSFAAQSAFMKRLNYEKPSLDALRQECQRRLMWTIFVYDKLFSGGIEDLSVCPAHRMHIKLPTNDYCFQRGLQSRSRFLCDNSESDSPDMDAVAYRMKLLDLRDRILRYTKRIIREGSSPLESELELRALDQELLDFGEKLPEELQLNPERLMLMSHSRDSTAYIILHSVLLLCRSDLHRFLIPGMREQVSTLAMSQTPARYISYCQETCLASAIKLCDFWSDIYHLEICNPIQSPTLTIAVYQCMRIIGHLHYLLPAEGDHGLDSSKKKLTEALSLAAVAQDTYTWLRPCIEDIRQSIPLLGTASRASGSRIVSSALQACVCASSG